MMYKPGDKVIVEIDGKGVMGYFEYEFTTLTGRHMAVVSFDDDPGDVDYDQILGPGFDFGESVRCWMELNKRCHYGEWLGFDPRTRQHLIGGAIDVQGKSTVRGYDHAEAIGGDDE